MTEYEKQATVLHEHGKLMVDLTIVGSTLPLEGQGCLDWLSRVGVYPWARGSEEACSEPSKRGWLRRRAIVIELCTETHFSDENLLLLTSVLENAVLPLTKEKILVNNDGK